MLSLAAALLFLLGLAHSVLGERYLLRRLFRRRTELPALFGGPEFTQHTLRFAWHLTAVAWWGFALLLAQLGRGTLTPSGVARLTGYMALASALLPLVITRGRHLAWVALLAVGALALAWSQV